MNRTAHAAPRVIYCTFVKRTAEVGAAVRLVLAGAAGLSFRRVRAALAPYTQLFTAALLVLSARLKEQQQCLSILVIL